MAPKLRPTDLDILFRAQDLWCKQAGKCYLPEKGEKTACQRLVKCGLFVPDELRFAPTVKSWDIHGLIIETMDEKGWLGPSPWPPGV